MKKMKIGLVLALLGAVLVGTFASFTIKNREVTRNVLQLNSDEADENGLYYAHDYIFEKMEPYDETYIHRMSDKLNKAYDKLLSANRNVYYSVIPDKGYFVENASFTRQNYEGMVQILNDEVKNMKYIPIMNELSIADYYKTDHHWRQEKLFPIIRKMGKYMDFRVKKSHFTENVVEGFHGVYSKYVSEIPKETLIYLTSNVTEDAKVLIDDMEERKGVYFTEQLKGELPYNMFLNGPAPLVTVINTRASNDRELLLFGDSYSSSLLPLLLEGYSKITLIDLRFVSISYLSEHMEFATQDVLFLYNTAVINRSAMLRFD